MNAVIKKILYISSYGVIAAVALNWLYGMEGFRSCQTVAPTNCGDSCQFMGAALQCTPSAAWYVVACVVLVVPVVAWSVVRITSAAGKTKKRP
ncbi:MAG: hypothetical protein QG658_65 [Patescibacteria group bacterium]|nr:hypothetical protein [Patescibacteria group bacterium]